MDLWNNTTERREFPDFLELDTEEDL
jgi:hypothetical protein